MGVDWVDSGEVEGCRESGVSREWGGGCGPTCVQGGGGGKDRVCGQ